jgi:hypothetical protein
VLPCISHQSSAAPSRMKQVTRSVQLRRDRRSPESLLCALWAPLCGLCVEKTAPKQGVALQASQAIQNNTHAAATGPKRDHRPRRSVPQPLDARRLDARQYERLKPNFRTLAAATAAKSQNSAILLDSYRIVVLKIRCPSDEFSVLTGSATACWHSALRRAFRFPGRRESRLYRDFRSVAHSNSPYQPRKVWCLKNLRH